MADLPTVQDNIRVCQSDMLHHSRDHVLHDWMVQECNKQSWKAQTDSSAAKADVPRGFPKSGDLLEKVDKNQR
jgi:hypothetical protein